MIPGSPGVTVLPVEGVAEVGGSDALAALLVAALGPAGLQDGDVLAVTSKVVSKVEGRAVAGDRGAALPDETDRVVAHRGETTIVRTHHGLVLAGAGVDASNTEPGTVLLLPRDPDGSARRLREELLAGTGCNVAVVVTDTAGRAWRHGQADLAIGAAGLEVMHDYSGRVDHHGNELAVTAPAVADEIASAADLVKGKLLRRPAAVVRGLADLVLPPGEHGPGAAALVREEAQDMFGYGAREAVLRALEADPAAVRGFGRPASSGEAAAVLGRLAGAEPRTEGDALVVPLPGGTEAAGRLVARLEVAAFALGWLREGDDSVGLLRFRSATP